MTVRKLERRLLEAGLPRFLVRLPVWWLCWYYCRMLDVKIARMEIIRAKFSRWLPVVRSLGHDAGRRTEMIDMDRCLRADISSTRSAMWELRSYCIDVATRLAQLGYASDAMQRRQKLFLSMLEESCELAAMLLEEVDAHDNRALALLQAEQLRERAASGQAASPQAATPL
ncbi:MAG: hypothetical protein ACEQSK_18920 [Sphingomonadaceae bacterium]